jgi:hypothetical protein
MNRTFQQAYHVPGTLTADLAIIFTAHADMTLLHVSMVCTNAASTTVAIGTTSSAAAYMAASCGGSIECAGSEDKSKFCGRAIPKDQQKHGMQVDHRS